jgi:hypothetical protein
MTPEERAAAIRSLGYREPVALEDMGVHGSMLAVPVAIFVGSMALFGTR